MVFQGRPSLGCAGCRKVHVKCDEGRPECGRCVRLKRPCTGYREVLDLMFRHKQFELNQEPKVNGREGRASKSLPSSKISHETARTQLSPALPTSDDNLALAFFYTKTLENLPEEDHSRYLLLHLSPLYTSNTPNSALRSATLAISHALYSPCRRDSRSLAQYSRRCYVQAVSAINTALQDPDQSSSDEILYAVMLLSGYETLVCDETSLPAWGSHVDGAIALLKLRGSKSLRAPFSRRLYYFIRRSSILSYMQMARPIDPLFIELASTECGDENPEDFLLSKTVHVPKLQSRTNELLNHGNCQSASEIVELLDVAKLLDQSLADWVDKLPESWWFETQLVQFSSDISPPTSMFVPSHVHNYRDIFVSRVWNLYRVSRLIVQSVILRSMLWLSENAADHHSPVDLTSYENVTRGLVNDICSSVPYLLGFDTDSKKQQIEDSLHKYWNLWPQNSMELLSPTMDGNFSLVWPLHVASSVHLAPKIQRDWIMAQFRWLGDAGNIPQASLVAKFESQTLSGRGETFRFDCV